MAFQALRALPERTPLRVKLIAGMLVLVALGMAGMSFASASVLQQYLVSRADDQLAASADRLVTQPAARIPAEMFVLVENESGHRLRSIPAFSDTGQPRVPRNVDQRLGEPFTVPSQGGSGAPWRVLAQPLPAGGLVVLGLSLDEVESTVRGLMLIDVIVGLLVVTVLAAAGVWVVRASLRPLAAIEQTAGAIAAGDLSRRVPEVDTRTEVGRLGRSLNAMLAQIEAAFGARARSEAAARHSEEVARRSEEQARRSEETARRSEERMRRFVADASHELRTPLTAIRGFAEFYRQGAARTPEELDRLIGRIEETAERMGLLVEDLLLLARLDQQRPITKAPADLLAIAADAVHEARLVAPGHTIDLAVEGGVAYQVLGDEPRLRQVLGNLLTNAVTHTPPGTSVSVRLRPGSLGGTPAAICEVADDGPGLTPEQAERVFERFYRASTSRGREDGSTGLGLAIVAALVAAHDGKVEVDSAPGEGAAFRVLLPLAT
jgi:signal transduction histidine kinase